MQYQFEHLQTLRKQKKNTLVGRARSLDHLHHQQLAPKEIKILLSIPKSPSDYDLELAVSKQSLLAQKKIFDPFKYFGSPNFMTLSESYRHHSPRLEAMFSSSADLTDRKIVKKLPLNSKLSKLEQGSPGTSYKQRVLSSEKSRRTVGRSPKSYVKENKQNFQRLNINNMQKVRVKLKLGRK